MDENQNIKVLNTCTGKTIEKTFQEWMNRAVSIHDSFNTDFKYLRVVK